MQKLSKAGIVKAHTENFEFQNENIPDRVRDVIVDMLFKACVESDSKPSDSPIRLDQLSSEVEKRHE